MTWTCPNCRREFKNTNQWHSCARADMEHHLRNKSPEVRVTLEKLLRAVRKFGKVTVDPVKTSIEVKTASTFVSIRPRRDHLEIGFQLGGEENRFPVYKTIRISKKRVLHMAILESPEDVDSQLVSWLEESCRLASEQRTARVTKYSPKTAPKTLIIRAYQPKSVQHRIRVPRWKFVTQLANSGHHRPSTPATWSTLRPRWSPKLPPASKVISSCGMRPTPSPAPPRTGSGLQKDACRSRAVTEFVPDVTRAKRTCGRRRVVGERRVMDKKSQITKAKDFLVLHHDPRLLVLPNIWDPLGARLLEKLGYPAVATASAAVAFSLGYDDGEKIRFDAMLDIIGRIADSVEVPLTADIERGYADRPDAVARNVQRVLRAGAVGINIEDSTVEGGALRRVDFQCARIRAVRAMAEREGIPLVINARIDAFLGGVSGARSDRVAETIARANAYFEAGADCVYPIMAGDLETLKTIRAGTRAPINVYATEGAPPMHELEAAGINRLSLGPGLLKASLTAMKNVARELRDYGSYDSFTRGVIPSDEIRKFVSKDEMP